MIVEQASINFQSIMSSLQPKTWISIFNYGGRKLYGTFRTSLMSTGIRTAQQYYYYEKCHPYNDWRAIDEQEESNKLRKRGPCGAGSG